MKRVQELFFEFKKGLDNGSLNTDKILFDGVNGHDVYNITAPFRSANKTIIAGRVEPRHHEKSKTVFFEELDNVWIPIPEAPVFELQDPFVTYVRNELVFGGVETKEIDGKVIWKTVFFRGSDIFNLDEFFHGPEGMKDIRLCDLENGKIAVFTRPQGDIGGRGTIGYFEIDGLEKLSVKGFRNADLLNNMYHPMDWGGVNEAHLLLNGEFGVLAHCACFSDDLDMGERHYYAKSFIFDPMYKQIRNYKIIACRDQFKDGPAKRNDISNVVFSSGLVRNNGKAILYAGISDAEAHWIEIDDPFCLEKP